jgi:hypothetical protein
MDRSTLLGAVRQIVRVVDVPVTVDFVAGYGDTPAAVSESVDALIDAGAVGMNIEDKMEEPDVLARKIGAIRELTSRRNVTFFVNARADTFLRPFDDAKRVDDAIRRLRVRGGEARRLLPRASPAGRHCRGRRRRPSAAQRDGRAGRAVGAGAGLGVARVSVGATVVGVVGISRRMAEGSVARDVRLHGRRAPVRRDRRCSPCREHARRRPQRPVYGRHLLPRLVAGGYRVARWHGPRRRWPPRPAARGGDGGRLR